MKTATLLISLFFYINAAAQLTYLGDDEIKNKQDGYASGKKTAGLVTLNGKYYFATPNGNFYETGGNEDATRLIEKFTPQDFMYLAATKKYVYYARNAGGGLVKEFLQYNPASGKISQSRPANAYPLLTVNGNEVRGNRQTADELYTSADGDKIFLRTFINDMSTVYVLDDNRTDNLADYVYSSKLNMNYITMPISTNTEINVLNNEIYFNGRTRPTGEYETSVSIYKPNGNNKNLYEYKTGFELKNRGVIIFDRFLRTKDAIYSFAKSYDSVRKDYRYKLFMYHDKKITSSKETLIEKSTDYEAQVIDGIIYVSGKGFILKFDEKESVFKDIYAKTTETESWEYVQKNKRFLKAGNYLLYNKGKKYGVYNMQALKTTDIKTPSLTNSPNFFTFHKTAFYAGANAFYFMDNVNGKEVFTKYDPVNNSYTPIAFPEFKKQSFGEIKAIYQAGNKFVFLTSYMDKKDKPVYKMFMYSEEGNPVIPVTPATAPVQPVTKTFDSKLFEQQINNIIAEPRNSFVNIMGVLKPGSSFSAPVNYSTVPVEGIGEGLITNYKDSKTLMYNAETRAMRKEEAAAIMETLEKQLQKIKLPVAFTKNIDYDGPTRRLINYNFNGKMATIELDMLRINDAADGTNWTVTFRIRK